PAAQSSARRGTRRAPRALREPSWTGRAGRARGAIRGHRQSTQTSRPASAATSTDRRAGAPASPPSRPPPPEERRRTPVEQTPLEGLFRPDRRTRRRLTRFHGRSTAPQPDTPGGKTLAYHISAVSR